MINLPKPWIAILFIGLIWSCKEKQARVKTFQDDPLSTQIYTLSNGMELYMSVNPTAPRIFTSIAVRTGSKNDPADATGLAHYLEHLLFKGSQRFGTENYEAEKVFLDQIEEAFENYRQTTNPAQRKAIYRQIDSLSQLAAQYAIPNEYDRMLTGIGASGTNAFTSFDETVYINDIPSNQLKTWMEIEAERFCNPVFRLFHTELEAVYEEKNISLDSDEEKVIDTLLATLFRRHNYGLQTTIGSVNHLKNPSLQKIRAYFDTYYVANNMAIIITGDFIPDSAIVWAERYFGNFRRGEVPEYKFEPEAPLQFDPASPIEILGPEEEFVMLGFRVGGIGTDDYLKLTLADMLMDNGMAGILNLELIQQQKVLNAMSYPWGLSDYSVWMLEAAPKDGQSLDEVRDLLLGVVEKLKTGDFPDWLPEAIVKDLEISKLRSFESNYGRNSFLQSIFIHRLDYEKYMQQEKRMRGISKQDIMAFAQSYFNNPVVVYKRNGEDPHIIEVEKPEITPIPVKRDTMSAFVAEILNREPAPIQPEFVDFNQSLSISELKPGLELVYHQNKENELFNLYYVIEWGSHTDRYLPVAIEYLPYLGTDRYTPGELKEAFYKTGCEFGVNVDPERIYVSLSGLQGDFAAGLELLEHLLSHANPNPEALQNLVSDILKNRENNKINASVLLWSGLLSYSKYGKDNPNLFVADAQALRELKPEMLTDMIHGLMRYKHRILYYGPASEEETKNILQKFHETATVLQEPPARKIYPELPSEPGVYFVHYQLQQAEVLISSRGALFNPELLPVTELFNEYFGGGMNSVVFQEIRESKAYAYAAFGNYSRPNRPEKHFYMNAYLGTQADKMPDAVSAMMALLHNMPESENNVETCKKNILAKLRSQRVMRTSLLWTYIQMKQLGLDRELRQIVYENISNLSLEDLKVFHQQYIAPQKWVVLVIGDRKKLNLNALKAFGPLRELKVDEIMP